VIKEVKEALDIPVIGSGDVFSALHVKKMFDETGCDGVAIARGALGNPWIFRDAAEYLKTGLVPARPDSHEVADVMTAHLRSIADYHGPLPAPVVFRKFFAWYTKGFRDVKPLKDRAFRAQTEEEMLAMITEFRENASYCQKTVSVSDNKLEL
jgi:tRNA-dihydrouridine synthase B